MISRSTADTYKKIFVFTTIPFGLCMGVFAGWAGGLGLGLLAGIGGGLFYGLSMALLIGALHQFSTKQLKTDYSEALLGVHQVQVLIIKQPFNQAFETCVSSVQVLKKCTITQQDTELGVIQAQTGTTWKSFGEKIMLMVSAADADSCKVTISSKPAMSTTLVDYGKNVENLRSIIDALNNRAAIVETLPGSDNPLNLISQDQATAADSGGTINVKAKEQQMHERERG